MRFPSLLSLTAIGVSMWTGLMAQQAPPAPRLTAPDGSVMPLDIPKPPPPLPPERVVVRVGEVAITAGQVDQVLDAYSDAQRVFANGPGRKQFIDQLVRVLMLAEEGKRRKLDQTDRYRNQLTYSAAGILSSHTEEDIRKNIKIDDTMLREYLAAHPLDYMQVRARHILIRTQGSSIPLKAGAKELTDAEALAKVQELRKKLEGGADFAALAAAESDDVSTSEKGGDLGYFKRGQLPPSIEEAAFAMKPGDLSQPVRTSMGYALIKVEEMKPARPFEDVRPELDKRLRAELTRRYVDDMKVLTKIDIDPEFASPSKSVTTAK